MKVDLPRIENLYFFRFSLRAKFNPEEIKVVLGPFKVIVRHVYLLLNYITLGEGLKNFVVSSKRREKLKQLKNVEWVF